MRRALLALALTLAAALPARADQTDPALEALFARLEAADGPVSARNVEREI